MKKLSLVAGLLWPALFFTQELPYTITVLNEEYVQLSEAISAVGDDSWDDPEAIIPIGFTFQLMDEVITEILLIAPGSQIIAMTNQDSVHFLQPYLADIIDIGYDTLNISPIRYATEGEIGSRIFKLEWYNVGFYAEWDAIGTTNNRTSFQMWLYEGTNVIEYRFGENTITDPSEIHLAGGPIIGIGSNAPNAGGWENFWMLHGDPLAPEVFNYTDQKTFPPVLDSEPPVGTVYHFGPTFVGVEENAESSSLNVYPTVVTNYINVFWKENSSVSKIYNAIGTCVMTTTINKGTQQIDISALSAGQYHMNILNDGKFYSTTIIKQ